MNKPIWRIGHTLNMLGFLEEACSIRELAAQWGQPGQCNKVRAADLVDHLSSIICAELSRQLRAEIQALP